MNSTEGNAADDGRSPNGATIPIKDSNAPTFDPLTMGQPVRRREFSCMISHYVSTEDHGSSQRPKAGPFVAISSHIKERAQARSPFAYKYCTIALKRIVVFLFTLFMSWP